MIVGKQNYKTKLGIRRVISEATSILSKDIEFVNSQLCYEDGTRGVLEEKSVDI